MIFSNIYWLYAIPPLLVILIISYYYGRKVRHKLFKTFASQRLLPNLISSYSPGRHLFKFIIFTLAVVLLLLTFARPQWGHKWEEQQAKGIDILFALDVSKSMLAEDIRPNRLERAKYSILDLLKELEGDRVGLIAFAGSAFLQCPLTHDYQAFRQTLNATDTSVINKGGTDIAAAIQAAEPSFAKENNFKFIVMITDGEDLEQSGIEQARLAAKNDVTIYTVGVGTQKGEIIPIKLPDGSTDFVRDSEGKIVKTKLDEGTLKAIANASGGFYVPLGSTGQGLEQVYESGLNTIPQQELASALRKVPLERFQLPLAAAILLLLVDSLLSTRKRKKKSKVVKYPPPASKAAAIIITFLIIASFPNNAEASVQRAYKAYNEGDFNKAISLYQKAHTKKPTNPTINYNLAGSFYKSKNFDAAAHALQDALETDNVELQQTVFYNLGNAYYRVGEAALETNPQHTIEQWEEALKQYQSAIELDEDDKQAKENYEFVKKKLEELKEQQKQEQQQQDQQDQDDNQDNKDQNQDQKEQDKQDQQQNQDKDKSQDNSDQQQDQNKDQKDNDQQDQQNQQQPQQQNEQEQEQRPQDQIQPKQDKLTKEEAEQILKALQNDEKKLPAASLQGDEENKSNNNLKDW